MSEHSSIQNQILELEQVIAKHDARFDLYRHELGGKLHVQAKKVAWLSTAAIAVGFLLRRRPGAPAPAQAMRQSAQPKKGPAWPLLSLLGLRGGGQSTLSTLWTLVQFFMTPKPRPSTLELKDPTHEDESPRPSPLHP